MKSQVIPVLLACVLTSCAGLKLPFSSPFQDTTAQRWCQDLTEAQAWYTRITNDLDQMVLRSDWALQYGLAKGAVEALGGRLLGQCSQEGITKEELAYGVSEGAEALEKLVEIHQSVTAPRPNETAAPLAALAAGPSAIPYEGLRRRLQRAEAEAKLVLSQEE